MKYSTKNIGPIPAHCPLLSDLESVDGLRILGRIRVGRFYDRLDETGRLEIARRRNRAIQLDDLSPCRDSASGARAVFSRSGIVQWHEMLKRGHHGIEPGADASVPICQPTTDPDGRDTLATGKAC